MTINDNWNYYIDNWIKESFSLKSIDYSKKLIYTFLEKYLIKTTELPYNFYSLLLDESKNMEHKSFLELIDFIIWFYNKTNKSSITQINDLKEKTLGIKFTRGKRSDPNFKWALQYDITLYIWTSSFNIFLELQTKSYNLYRQSFNNFLDYLIDYPSITRNPFVYIQTEFKIFITYKEYAISVKNLDSKGTGLRDNLSKLFDFFEWFLINNCLEESNKQLIKNGVKNPIEKSILKHTNKVETHRNSLPTTYLRQLEEILTENDYAWPKSQIRQRITYKGKRIWNPLTTYLLLLKLKTPLRTHQIRYLDSGEGDKFYFDYSSWSWIENPNAIYKDEKEYKGVFKKIIDRNTNKELVGLYINTNKTNDRNSEKKGYIIPWESKDIIKIISDLLIWQKKHNPITMPYKWIDIQDVMLKKKSKSTLKEMGENFFLFRDMFNRNPNEPLLDSKIQMFWKKLLAELERRVNNQRLLVNQDPIYFIQKWEGKIPKVSKYDLHSLRVTNITALYQAGVPYSILSKYVAGHSTILMTIYYTKFSQTHISETLNKATKNISLLEQENFNNFITNAKYEELEEKVIYNDISSIDAITQLSNKNSLLSDIGICPVGENKCEEGGKLLTTEGRNFTTYAPVPNGPKNCVRCRFFITGVPFLIGLSTKFNELSVVIKEKSHKYRKVQEIYEKIYHERYLCEKENKPFLKWKDLELADSHYNKHNNELDELLIDWQALYNLIEQCQVLQNKSKDIKNFTLITNDSIENMNILINECSDFELYDSVCQSSIFYESIQPNIANIKRNQIINKMLLNNEMEPYFIFLDEDDALIAANQFTKYLMTRLGKNNSLDIMNNKKKLIDFGISIEVKDEIENILENKYEYNNKLLIKVDDE